MNKWTKWAGRILLGVLVLFILLILLIHTAPVKNLIRGKLESYLVKKTNSEVHIAGINYRLPKWVELNGVFFRDKAGDTLLFGNKLRIDINMLKLLKGQYEVSRVELGDISINISRKQNDSLFNYQYLIDAFASKTPSAKPEKSTISFSLDQVEINRSALTWKDQYGGTLLETRIGKFSVDIDSLDINTQKYAVSKSTIDDMYFDLHLLKSKSKKGIAPVTNVSQVQLLPMIKVDKLNITKSHFAFKGEDAGVNTVNDIDEMKLEALAIAAPQKITLDKLQLNNSSVLLDRDIIEKVVDKIKQIDTVTSNMAVVVKDVRFSNNTLTYNDLSGKKKGRGLDPSHIKIRSLNAGFKDIGYGDNKMKVKIDSMSLKEQSGFILDSMHGNLNMHDTAIFVHNLLFKTPYSRIAGEAIVYPLSLDTKYKGNSQNSLTFTNNIIARRDIALLAPSIMEKYNRQLEGVSFVYVTADMRGNARKTVIKKLLLHSNKNDLNLNANGTVYNVLSKDAFIYDLNIIKITASKSFLDPFVNTAAKQTVNLPPVMNVTGKLKGDMKQLTSDLVFTSAYGVAGFKGQLKNFTNPDKLSYNMRLLAKNLETGKWVNQDSVMGQLNGSILVKGSGIDYKTATIESVIDVNSFRLQKHVYTGINFNINGVSGTYDLKGKIADSLLKVNMDVKTALNQQYPTAVGKVNVHHADLYALGLYKDTFSFRSDIDLQAKDLSPQTLDALIRFDSTIVYQGKTIFRTDSMIARGRIDSGKTILTLNSSFADATIKGQYKYDELPNVLATYLAKYSRDGKSPSKASDANFIMDMNLKPDPVYALLLPGLFFDKNIHANGKIDTKQKDSTLQFYLTAPVIAYQTNRLSNLRMDMKGVGDSIQYSILLDTARASSIQLYTTSITGSASKGNVSAGFITNDNNKKQKYAFGVRAAISKETYELRLSDTLKLNYVNWNVDKNNMTVYSPQGINVSQLTISKGAESISVNSSNSAANAPMDIKIEKFALSNITGLFHRDSLEIAGRLNAQVKVDGLDKRVPLFNGTVKVDSLIYQQGAVGDLAIEARNESAEAVSFTGKLTGNGNNVDLQGNYNQDKIDAQLKLNPIQFKSIEPFTQKNLTRSSGKLSGNISITGDVKNPEWNGTIHFDSAFTQLAKYGTILKMNGQQIDLKYPVVTLNQFTIRDSLDHRLVINGTLNQANGDFNTDLTVKTRNFIVLDNSPDANSEIYGKAIVDVDVIVTGPAATPEITGNIGLKDNSVVTFVRQEQVSSAKDRVGVIEFIDMDTVKNYVFRPTDTVFRKTRREVAMFNYNLNIDIDKNAIFSIIIDPITRDELQVQGAGQLNASVNPNGEISLTGAYNLNKGSYQLNYKFFKRKFELQEGSTIVLSGDPRDAEANITAIYEIEASPYDLLANEISENNNSALYKQKIPFQVILNIKGKLISPQLSFDLQMKDNVNGVNYDMTTTIENKFLQMRGDASTMNKQVFALLVMGRFIGEQSQDFFAGSNGDGIKADKIIKQSVSRFLSDAVSQVASDLIKGVEVDVDLKTVDNYGDATQRTDLNLALSKRFMNDRLNISVGKNFTIDGEDPLAKGQENSNVSFLPDVTTTYKLSKDGRYMLKAYQKSDYEAILDGYFIETGVAFTLSVDYNTIKDFFRKERERKGQKKDRKTKKEK
jgi:translocation and assembly module TamB